MTLRHAVKLGELRNYVLAGHEPIHAAGSVSLPVLMGTYSIFVRLLASKIRAIDWVRILTASNTIR